MLSQKNHSLIVDIIVKTSDSDKLLMFIEMVKSFPDEVIETYNKIYLLPFEKSILEQPTYIEAIKFYRTSKKNVSLTEAKEYVDHIYDKHNKSKRN